jgi:predicted O-methyltransferase YrrM
MDLKTLESRQVKGYMPQDEARRLYALAKEACHLGPCLEIGSYCGCSAAYLGLACQEAGGILFSIDHHGGSEEQQPGQEYFDPDLLDSETGKINTLPIFLKVIADVGLEGTVIPIVGRSVDVARNWRSPLSLVFIDGGHTFEAAFLDYSSWSPHLLPGGFLIIHDIFSDPAQGGRAPYCIYQMALASGLYTEELMIHSLGVLRRAPIGSIPEIALHKWQELGA